MRILLFFVLVVCSLDIVASNQNEIKIKIIGNFDDSTLFLTSYYGDKIIIIDTAYAHKPGQFIFKGQKKLAGGIYMIVGVNKNKLFEFIVGTDQKFILNTNTSNYVGSMKVRGSIENTIFFSYLNYNEQQFSKIRSINIKIDSLHKIDEKIEDYSIQIDSVKSLATNYKLSIIKDNKGTFVSRLLNSMRDVEVPDSIKNSVDGTLVFRYYKQHYWDYLDLSDSCLLRTPILMRKVNQYFDQLVVLHPDTVISAIDTVISQARPSKEVVGYLVWYFVSEYQNPEYMGFDKVFVHIVDEYFTKEQISNTTPSILSALQERADKIRPLLLNKQAPDLILVDTVGAYVSFSAISNKYTILFFWDSDCGVCTKEIKELRRLYDETDFDIEVFAINTNSDLVKWKIALLEKDVPGINVNGTRSATKDFHDLYDIYGTPVIYILDKDKKIIAKRITADKIQGFIEAYKGG